MSDAGGPRTQRNRTIDGETRAPSAAEEQWRAWMIEAQRGDAVAYRKLLEDLLPVVRGWLRARLFDAELVDDVVQNAMLNLHRARATYRAERAFGPWLRAIVRNAATDALRSSARRAAREQAVEDVERIANAPEQESGGSSERTHLSSELRRALDELPARQREAVELIHLRGLSVAAAAAHAGTTVGALKVRAHRGYRSLRARLARVGARASEDRT